MLSLDAIALGFLVTHLAFSRIFYKHMQYTYNQHSTSNDGRASADLGAAAHRGHGLFATFLRKEMERQWRP